MVIEANEKITVITEVDKLRRGGKDLGHGVDSGPVRTAQ